jgi:hypothetical protein
VLSQGGEGAQDDGVNQEAWLRLCQAVTAAHRGDGRTFTRALMRWRDEVPLPIQQRSGAYLLYLMWRHLASRYGRKPTSEDLHELAVSCYPRFRKLLKASEAQLEAVLRRALSYPPSGTRLTPAEFTVFGCVALGLLLADPQQELDLMRPGMASWWQRNKDHFRAEGLLDERSP